METPKRRFRFPEGRWPWNANAEDRLRLPWSRLWPSSNVCLVDAVSIYLRQNRRKFSNSGHASVRPCLAPLSLTRAIANSAEECPVSNRHLAAWPLASRDLTAASDFSIDWWGGTSSVIIASLGHLRSFEQLLMNLPETAGSPKYHADMTAPVFLC